MDGKGTPQFILRTIAAAGLLLLSAAGMRGQDSRLAPSTGASVSGSGAEARMLTELVRDLQAQVQALDSQLGDLRAEQQRAGEETRELRRELALLRAREAPGANESAEAPVSPRPPAPPQYESGGDRIGKLEEDEQVIEGKINDQYQTKVESGSKYRLRLSGIILLNMFENRGSVSNQDFPEYALPPQPASPYNSPGTFGGSLRQSQIRLQTFGPEIGSARTSADVTLDFAGGFPAGAPNGATMGIVRLRTGTVRLDWPNTSIIAGQDRLFFVPLAPSSLASLAIPALSYAGNLWAWTPQVRVERRVTLTEASSLSFQGGILDNLTGDLPAPDVDRYASWGEQSGQPAYAARISWSHQMFGRNFTVGAGGYYSRQNWGFTRNVDGWAGTADLEFPLGKRFQLTGAFYRGRAVAGLAGAMGQDVVVSGDLAMRSTTVLGLDSMGGWAQLKFTPISKLEINGAVGLDNPFAGELRRYSVPTSTFYSTFYSSSLFTRNLSPLVNFIYQVRSNILLSAEYRHLNTSILDSGSSSASHVNLSLGYIF